LPANQNFKLILKAFLGKGFPKLFLVPILQALLLAIENGRERNTNYLFDAFPLER
jgi:hypothetical protein